MDTRRRKVDKGPGIHVRRGGFRIPAGGLRIDLSSGELQGSGVVPELRTDLFDQWLLIAEESANAAAAAREVALDADPTDSSGFNGALEHEFRASLIAVSSAAFAVEAFFGSVVEHAPDARVNCASRVGTVFETLKRAFQLSGEYMSAVHESLTTIYRLRDEAVHPPASWSKPILHPAFNLGMEPRFVAYTSENAIKAFLVVQKLIASCLSRPKAEFTELKAWCDELADLVEVTPAPAWVALDDPFDG